MLSHISDSFGTPWAVARQAPLSMVFPKQEYCNGLPFPFLGIFPTSPALASRFFTTQPPETPTRFITLHFICYVLTTTSPHQEEENMCPQDSCANKTTFGSSTAHQMLSTLSIRKMLSDCNRTISTTV